MPFKTFNNWLFDGRKDTPIPKPKKNKDGKVIVPDITRYNSPITHTFVISLFLKHVKLNRFLDEYFNNMNLRYLSREEIFKFIKKCVIDFRVNKRDMIFYSRQQKNILYDVLRERIPFLKNDDLLLLTDQINVSENKQAIFDSLGLEKPKKIKLKRTKKKVKKITLDEFLDEHFSISKSI